MTLFWLLGLVATVQMFPIEFIGYCSHTTIPRGVLAYSCQNPETYKPKFHCRRQSGMNFGYDTVNGVNSNVHRDGEICIIKISLTNAQKPVIVKNRFGVLLDRQALTGHKCYFLMFMGVSAFFDAFFTGVLGSGTRKWR